MIQQILNSLPRVNEKDQSLKKTGEERKSVFYFVRALLPIYDYRDHHGYSRSEDTQGNTNLHPFSHVLV